MARDSDFNLGKVVAGGTSGYVGIDSALEIITDAGLVSTLVDPSGSVAMGAHLLFLLSSVLYLIAMTGLVEFTGR